MEKTGTTPPPPLVYKWSVMEKTGTIPPPPGLQVVSNGKTGNQYLVPVFPLLTTGKLGTWERAINVDKVNGLNTFGTMKM